MYRIIYLVLDSVYTLEAENEYPCFIDLLSVVIRFLHRLEKVDCQSGEKMRSLEGSPFTLLQTQKREINSSILSFYIFIVHKHLYANAFPALTTLRIIHIFASAAEQWQQHQPVVFHPILLPVQCQSPEPGVEFYQG